MATLKLGIRTRINGGFGVLVALSLGLTGFAYWQLSGIGEEVARLSRLSDLSTRAAEIGDAFEAIRFAMLRFRAFGEASALQPAAEAETRAAQLLEDARKTTVSDQRRRAYENLTASLGDIRASREALLELAK